MIRHLRGYPSATRRLDQLPGMTLSAVTYLEIVQGLRDKTEFIAVQKMFALRRAVRLPLTQAITDRAVTLMESLSLSHGLQLGDALIAATALEHGLRLLTGNDKHFAAITDLKIEKFEP